jgi:hypothetical protein
MDSTTASRLGAPPHLGSRQSRVNDDHHSENFLLPDEGEELTAD